MVIADDSEMIVLTPSMNKQQARQTKQDNTEPDTRNSPNTQAQSRPNSQARQASSTHRGCSGSVSLSPRSCHSTRSCQHQASRSRASAATGQENEKRETRNGRRAMKACEDANAEQEQGSVTWRTKRALSISSPTNTCSKQNLEVSVEQRKSTRNVSRHWTRSAPHVTRMAGT